MTTQQPAIEPMLVADVASLIHSAKQRAAVAVNSELTLLYWHVGQRINQAILGGERADYGKQIVAELAKALTVQFGRGWSKRNLFQMLKFAEQFCDLQIVQTLSAQLSWSHFVQLCAIDDPLKRNFYSQMAITERWSTRTLDERIGAMLFERTAISKKPAEAAKQRLAQDK